MKFENIVRNLEKAGYKMESMEFDHIECIGVTGTALVDVENNKVTNTTGKYKDVVEQIQKGMSHINNIEDNKKSLSVYCKYNG